MSIEALPQEVRVALGIFFMLVFVALVAWLLWRALRRSVDPARLLFRWIATLVTLGVFGYAIHGLAGDGTAAGQIAGVLAGAVLGLVLAILWLPAIIGKVSESIGSLFTGGSEPPVPTPAYSVAQARRKQSQFKDAIYAIQAELQRFPTDVTGQMMLAEIQAEDLRDLEAASATVDRFLTQDHAPRNIAFALNSLADWQLKIARDPGAAQAALQRIVDRLPDTEEARNAAQRLAHLATPEELRRRDAGGPIQLTAGVRDLGLLGPGAVTGPAEEDPEAALARLTGHLAEHPLDADAREKLALLQAGPLGMPDAAIDQFRLLAEHPNQTPREAAKWLHRIADLQVLQGASYESVCATLQEIIDRFPGLAPAEMARQRLEKVRLELKGKEKSQVVKLGSYEKDLGLKGPPRDSHPGLP